MGILPSADLGKVAAARVLEARLDLESLLEERTRFGRAIPAHQDEPEVEGVSGILAFPARLPCGRRPPLPQASVSTEGYPRGVVRSGA